MKAPIGPCKLVLLPGLDGTGVLLRPFVEALPPSLDPIVVTYPRDQDLGYDELLPLALRALPRGEPFYLLGESFGGPLSLRVAATRPAGLGALILCASFVSCPQRLVPSWVAPLVRPSLFRFFPQFAQMKALLGGFAAPRLLALYREALSQVQPHVFAHRVREVLRVNVADLLINCEVPILYIQGEHDRVVPSWNLRRIRCLKPTVQTARIAAPHMVLQTQADAAVQAILQFMSDNVG